MNLEQLCEKQKELDNQIIQQHNLHGQNLLPGTVLALQVELAELANEWQGFKHWKANPKPKPKLLEEYADGLHFFLSLAIQKGWEDHLYVYEEAIDDIREDGFDGGITTAFTEINYWLTKIVIEHEVEKYIVNLSYSKHEFSFKNAWFIFLSLGIVGFNFTPEQIEEAYLKKNEVNHKRQQEGY